MTADEVVRPLLVLVLVLTEVALWQWRTILTAREATALPTVLGVVGAVLQVTAIAQVVTHVDRPVTVIAYALGVGGGVLAGVLVSTRFSAGTLGVNVITTDPQLTRSLQLRGWPVTSHHGEGHQGQVEMLLIVIDGKHRAELVADLLELDRGAFWTMEKLRPGPTMLRPLLQQV